MKLACSITIARSAADIFAFVADARNDVLWCPKVNSVEAVGDPTPRPGARFEVVHRPMPIAASRRMDYRLVGWNPPHEIEWHADDGHDRIRITYRLQPLTETTTRFSQHDDLDLCTPRWLDPLMRIGIRHDIDAQMRRLRRKLEEAT